MASKRVGRGHTPSAVVQLTRTQAASLAGDAFLTISLAKSLLFNVSAGAARPKVLLYLLITMVPFAVLAPVVGPLVDHLHRGRRAVVAATCFGRGLLCLLMAGDLGSILLYPEAFGALMLGKGYAVANKALVPTLIEDPQALVGVNSRLARIGLVGGAVAAPLAGGISKVAGSPWTLRTGLLVYVGAGVLALRLPKPDGERPRRKTLAPPAPDVGAGRGGLFDGEPYFAEMKGRRTGRGARFIDRLDKRQSMPGISEETLLMLSASAMGILRGAVGFLTFLAIFVLKTNHSSLLLYGLVLAAGVVGSFVGAVVAPPMRRRLREQTILVVSMVLPLVFSLADWWKLGKDGLSLVALSLGIGASAGRVAFDSLVQRNAPEQARGRAFARYETRFQLTWVGGAFLAVVVHFGTTAGMVLLSGALGLGASVYSSGLRGRRNPGPHVRPAAGPDLPPAGPDLPPAGPDLPPAGPDLPPAGPRWPGP
ncbi:MAG: MFS transporter [Acidimicrobiales bacterium]